MWELKGIVLDLHDVTVDSKKVGSSSNRDLKYGNSLLNTGRTMAHFCEWKNVGSSRRQALQPAYQTYKPHASEAQG